MILEPSRGVLAGIIPDRKDLLVDAMRSLTDEHFTVEAHRQLWRVLCRTYDQGGGVVTEGLVRLLASRMEAAKGIMLRELYVASAGEAVTEEEFRVYAEMLREERASSLTGEALTNAMELLLRGGEVEGKEVDPGPESAWDYIQREYAHIVQMASHDSAPEGDVWSEASDILADYADRKERAATGDVGVLTGVESIDRATGGLQNGDLVLIVGYTGAGKSQACTQLAWHASVVQGKNVVFFTSETTRKVTRRRLIARHSRQPRFEVPTGLNSKALKEGSLSPDQEATLQRVVHDLDHGARTGAYGHLYVAQVPPSSTLGYVDSTMRRVHLNFPIDLVIVDYLALLRSERKRDSNTQEMTELLKHAKVLATTFDNGRGVPIVSPWQVTRAGYEKAVDRREYAKTVLSDTSEAEKTSDILISLLALPDEPNRLTTQFLKNRDGEVPRTFTIDVDYRTSWMGASKEVQEVRAVLDEQQGAFR